MNETPLTIEQMAAEIGSMRNAFAKFPAIIVAQNERLAALEKAKPFAGGTPLMSGMPHDEMDTRLTAIEHKLRTIGDYAAVPKDHLPRELVLRYLDGLADNRVVDAPSEHIAFVLHLLHRRGIQQRVITQSGFMTQSRVTSISKWGREFFIDFCHVRDVYEVFMNGLPKDVWLAHTPKPNELLKVLGLEYGDTQPVAEAPAVPPVPTPTQVPPVAPPQPAPVAEQADELDELMPF